MKNVKVKGFTLIELIVVMATFTIIMFGATQLIAPVRSIFTSTYDQESLSASTDNIKRYLEKNLRYAEYVRLTETEPDEAYMRQFVTDYYDGMIMVDGAGGHHYAEGDIYVMKIDNSQGGKISQYRYTYTVGDAKDEGRSNPVDIGDPNPPKYLDEYYTIPADEDDIEADISDAPAESYEWAINKAMYSDYHFNISLGQYNLVNNRLEEEPGTTFNSGRFCFTITAYKFNPTKGLNRKQVTEADGSTYYEYEPGYVRNANMALANLPATGRTYLTYSYLYNDDEGKSMYYDKVGSEFVTDEMLNDGSKTIPYAERTVSANPFVSTGISNFVDPDVFYIVYTYPGNTIVK